MIYQDIHSILAAIPEQQITKKVFKQLLPDNPVILEAGAHIGRNTLKFAKFWPKSIIYAFEPVPQLYQQLVLKTVDNTNIYTFNKALSNHVSQELFFVSSGRTTTLSSLYAPIKDVGLASHEETIFSTIHVDTITIDQFALEQAIEKIDFMWLDLQGAELQALTGAQRTLKTTRLLFIEASIYQRYEQEPRAHELINWLQERNFKPLMRDKEKHGKINILLIHNAHYHQKGILYENLL